MEHRFRVEMLGRLGLRDESGSLPGLSSQRTVALLAYLAYHAARPVPRDVLAEALWPEAMLDQARGSLNTTLWALRRELRAIGLPVGELLRSEHGCLRLEGGFLTTDVAEFESTLSQARSTASVVRLACLQRAVALYTGDLLPGFTEEWIYPERTRLRGLYLQALADLADLHAQANEYEPALDAAGRALAAEPLDVAACARLMQLYVRAGQPGMALRLYDEFGRRFRERMDMEPGEGLDAQAAQARAAQAGSTPFEAAKRSPSAEAVAAQPASPATESRAFTGGALPPDSPYYVRRDVDVMAEAALSARESVVLLKGPRQTGKSSLLARGLQVARDAGTRVAFLDLQTLTGAELETPERFFLVVAQALADQLAPDALPEQVWEADRGAGRNLRHYLRTVILPRDERPLVWALDEVDRLFTCPFGNEVFGLLRSWHNERALDPSGPWRKLSLVLAYATEAHLFITDLNQSPFNIGVRLELGDFTPEQTRELAARFPSRLSAAGLEERFSGLLSGHPFLVHRALHAMGTEGRTFAWIEETALQSEGLFFSHLSRLGVSLRRDAELCAAVSAVLAGRKLPEMEAFLRLRSAGVLVGEGPGSARVRCGLYRRFLTQLLA